MKTKYSRLGNSAVSIVLAVLMVISSTIVGSSSSIDSIAADTPDTVSQTVAESKTAVSELGKTADDENKEAFDNTPSITKNTKGALDIQPSGVGGAAGVRIIGTKLGTDFSNYSSSSQTIEFENTETTHYISSDGSTTTDTTCRYLDVYLSGESAFYFQMNVNNWVNRALKSNITPVEYSSNNTTRWATTNGNSTTTKTISNNRAGMYRIYVETDTRSVRVNTVKLAHDRYVVGGGASTTAYGQTFDWANMKVPLFKNDGESEFTVPFTKGSGIFEFKLLDMSGNWYGCAGNDPTAIGLSTTTNNKIAVTNSNNGGNIQFSGAAGDYVLHCDSSNNVWITEAVQNRTITKGTETNGSFLITDSADGTTAIQQAVSGSTVYVKTTPTSDSYYASGVTISGADVDVTKVDDNLFSFTMPNADITVTANIVQKKDCTVSVTTNDASFGSVDNSTITATTGEVVTLTATPANSNYKFNGWTVTTGSDNFTTSNDLSTDSTISLCVLDDFTIQANFVSKNNVRIYFFDNENFGLPFLHCWGASSGENTEWPGIEMTPVDGYINLYYADLSESELGFTVTGMMFDNVTRSTYEQSDGGTSEQDQGSQTTGVTINGLSNYNNKVFKCGSFIDDATSADKYKYTLTNTGKTLTEYNTSYPSGNANAIPLAGDSGYQRIYFYDKNKNWTTNTAYVQYGNVSNDYSPFLASNTKNVKSASTSSSEVYRYWPGKRMIPISSDNYSSGNLFYADIPVANDITRVRFTDGYLPNDSHITKSLQLSGNANKVAEMTSLGLGGENNGTQENRAVSQINWSGPFVDNKTVTVDPGTRQVVVYAKSGTIRDSYEKTDKFSKMAQTTFAYTDGTSLTVDYSDYKYKVDESDPNSAVRNRLGIAAIDLHKEITITTTIDSDYKDKIYVKGFSINGESDDRYIIWNQDNVPKDANGERTGIYTCTFEADENTASRVEITPIYYFFTDDTDADTWNDSSNFITFSAEDFTGDVADLWKNQIACYAFYSAVDSNGNSVETPSDTAAPTDSNKAALGGYPGQPMLNINGTYYIQVPKTLENGAVIEGITLNNYVWDDVHSKYILQLNMNSSTDREKNNCQTYDYDDFVALANTKQTKKIVFMFKYETYNNNNNTNASMVHNKGNTPTSETTNLDYITGEDGNGWNVLVDYYGNPVDIFSRRLKSDSNTYLTESAVSSKAANEKIYIVSNGYEAYYKQQEADSNKASDNRAKYVGQYGTRWYVYKTTDGSNFSYVGALPPSAFLSGLTTAGDVPVVISDYTPNTSTEISQNNFLNYSTAAEAYKAGGTGTSYNDLTLSTWENYQNIFNQCAGKPAVIAYESNLYSAGKSGTTQNPGYRSDGRWYYSKPDEMISAKIKVQVIDANGDIVNFTGSTNDSYHYDSWTSVNGEYVSDFVKAKASFTNEPFEVTKQDNTTQTYTIGGKVECSVPECDPTDPRFYTFVADHTTVGSDGNHYIFRGWYYNYDNDQYSAVNSMTNKYSLTGQKMMDSTVTLIARYQQYDPNATLKVTHDMLYKESKENGVPVIHNGKGTASVKVEILDNTEETVFEANNTTPGLATIDAVTLADLKVKENSNNYKVKVTLTTVTDSGTTVVGTYRKETENDTNTYYKSGTTGFTEPDSGNNGGTQDSFGDANDGNPAKTLTTSTSGSTKTSQLVYEYTFAELYNGDNLVKPELKFFSDALTNTISVEFCYYDRKIENGKPTTIKDSGESFTTEVSISSKTVPGAIADALEVFNNIDKGNVIDSYMCWATQAAAVADDGGIKSLDNYRSPNAEKDSGYNSYADSLVDSKFKYQSGFDAKNNNAPVYTEYEPDFTRHTNQYGMPQQTGSTEEKWVTYYDAAGKEITTDEDILVDAQKTSVSSVKVWLYNTPKLYTVNVWAPTGANAPTVMQNLDGKYYTNNNPVPQKGFYNQRIGVKDTNEGGIAAGSNSQSDYLTGYGIHTVYTGDIIAAPTRIHRNNEQADLLFDGWYSATISGTTVTDLTKVSSDVVYGNRITTDLTLVAVYKESVSNQVGVSVTDNGIDYYVENNTRMVRLNTELNVYNAKDSDPNIKQVSAIYVRLPSRITVNAVERPFTKSDLTTDIANSIKKDLQRRISSGMLDRDFTDANETVMHIVSVEKLACDANGKIISYTLTVNDDTNHSATLTNKNRTQFVMPMAAVYYEGGANCAIMAFAAINYDNRVTRLDENGAPALDENNEPIIDGENKWILSDNYVPYIYYVNPEAIPG